MKKELDVKKELSKLKANYEKEKLALRKKCKHDWYETRLDMDIYSGTQWYRCSICGEEKGESF